MSWKKEKNLANIDDEKLVKKNALGLDATKLVRLRSGELIERPDYIVQFKYLELAYRLKGRLPYDPRRNLDLDADEMRIEFE